MEFQDPNQDQKDHHFLLCHSLCLFHISVLKVCVKKLRMCARVLAPVFPGQNAFSIPAGSSPVIHFPKIRDFFQNFPRASSCNKEVRHHMVC